jgi:hypothetical protein
MRGGGHHHCQAKVNTMNDEERYRAAAHAMQSGVAFEMSHNPKPTEPKQLRTGVNAALVDHAALADLLIEKGVFSKEEYLKALADGMEQEKARYEAHLTELTGTHITLG